MMKQRLVITGIGRSGTKYMSEVLTRAGIDCGHEKVYNGYTFDEPNPWKRPAESSWFAAKYDLSSAYVVHLVRQPLRWLSSWATRIWPANAYQKSQAVTWLCWATGKDWYAKARHDGIDAAMELFLEWTRRARARADEIVLIEDLVPEEITGWASEIGVEVQEKDVMRALRDTPKTINSLRHGEIRWAQCKDKLHAEAFADLASWYGYELR